MLPESVRVALTAGQAAVLPTTALKFEKDIYLEDNGEGLPLGNAPYTVEFWVRFGGQHGCFAGWGVTPISKMQLASLLVGAISQMLC